jgi:hypothetical protein
MTLDELKHIFRHQMTESEDFKPTDNLEYWLFSGQDKVLAKVKAEDLEKNVLPALEGYQFDGYRNRTPLFVKPDVIIPL